MSEKIITLFGEEIVPEQQKAVGRSRAKKKLEEKKEEEPAPTESMSTVVQEVTRKESGSHPLTAGNGVVAAVDQEHGVASEIPGPERSPKVEAAKADEPSFILPEDWKGDKQYYSIGEVADLFNVKTSKIRFWTNEFKLKIRTTRKGDRLYTADQIREIKAIHHLVAERGFTLAGARAKLSQPESMEVQTIDLKKSLLQLRNKLMTIKNQLN